ncbi:MAG: hypothetical protein HY755_01425 [Nitrospirae bacterium]|nr:hypothetical protein [Nitrospirota bacterium]
MLIGANEDNEWSIRGYFLKGFYLDEPLTVYKKHEGQVTKENIGGKINNQIRCLDYIIHKNISLISRDKHALIFRLQQLGHLCILGKEYSQAVYYFKKALRNDPFNPKSIALYAIGRFSPFLYKFIARLGDAVRL